MFYKTNFGKPNQRPPKQLQQVKVHQKLTNQMKLKIHQRMDQEKSLSKQLDLPVSSTKYNKFYINMQGIVNQEDPTIAWISPALTPIQNQRARNLFIKKQSYLITNYYGSDYPRSFWVSAPGVNGYLDENGVTTNRVSTMVLVNISSNIDESGQKFYDLLYSQEDEVTWTLPSNGVPITFKLAVEGNNFLQMPLPNPISINFQIRQIGI